MLWLRGEWRIELQKFLTPKLNILLLSGLLQIKKSLNTLNFTGKIFVLMMVGRGPAVFEYYTYSARRLVCN